MGGRQKHLLFAVQILTRSTNNRYICSFVFLQFYIYAALFVFLRHPWLGRKTKSSPRHTIIMVTHLIQVAHLIVATIWQHWQCYCFFAVVAGLPPVASSPQLSADAVRIKPLTLWRSRSRASGDWCQSRSCIMWSPISAAWPVQSHHTGAVVSKRLICGPSKLVISCELNVFQ